MAPLKRLIDVVSETWTALRTAFGGRRRSRPRAGVRFPELFTDDPFVVSINIAKWQIWLACLSDLSVYAGFLMLHRTKAPANEVRKLVRSVMDDALAVVGTPDEAGPEFAPHADRIRARLALCDLTAFADDESAFTESPAALVQWAPIVDDLKQLDAEVVRNSVRFRWQEVRRDLRRDLRADAVLAEASAKGAAAIAVP